MDDALPLGLAGDALVAKVAGITTSALEGWSSRWGIEAACQVNASAGTLASETLGERWFVERGVSQAVRLQWPETLDERLGRVLYGITGAPPPASLAARSVRHVADDLLGRLAETWMVTHWDVAGVLHDKQPQAAIPAHWQALLEVRLDIAGTSLRALVPGQRFRTLRSTPSRQLSLAATISAFSRASATVQAVVGRTELSLAEVAQLQPGDVLVLDARLQTPIELRIADGDARLPVALGKQAGRRAIQLLSPKH